MALVENVAVQSSQLLRPRDLMQRVYVTPFLVLYPLFFQVYMNQYDTYIKGSEWTFVYLGSIISIHAVLMLAPNWSISIDALFNYVKVDKLSEASHILLQAAPNFGAGAITEITRHKYSDEIQTSFIFQKRRFLYHPESGKFTPPQFKIDEEPLLKELQTSKGISGDLSQLTRVYGKNHFDIPIPSFWELFKEHATAPFFVFQIFCVGLWLLDEFWYYSLFTLFMLVTFECTTVFQRRTTMGEFRTMGVKPFSIWVHRDGKWRQTETTELLPGDLVSITRTGDDYAIPCDLVLVDGAAIVNEAMLSGESTPLLKESIKLRPGNAKLDLEGLDKNSVLHGGTKALQVTPPTEPIVAPAPDKGALAIVSKTGFETSQGSLVRVMIFSAERVSVGNMESFFFILFLLVFAIAASWYVWVEGTKMGRIQNKLILDCVLIITSVVPPELPMELTLAVNTSLAALSKFYIYCTEPFRIPMAGRIDVCCFDKTGTLTGEDLVFEGLAGFGKDIRHLAKPSEVPNVTNLVLGSAHALVKLDDGEVVGDPMEKATLEAVGWNIGEKDVVFRGDGKNAEKIKILRRFQFSSALKRSASISTVDGGKTLVSVKGAPETIRSRLTTVPDNYEHIYKSFTRSGSRVLAIAYKFLEDNITHARVNKIDREDVEEGLEFAGFLVFHCPLKDDAIETIAMLNQSSHRSIMITGDNPLTAVFVANEVKIVEREVLILDAPEEHHGDHELIWRNVDETKIIPFSSSSEIDVTMFKTNDIAITGYALAKLLNHPQLHDLIKHTWVYARVSPAQKEFILNTLKHLGYNTLMCGDGTNDVGALKQAHVGVALLNGTEEGMKKIAEQRKIEATQKVYEKQCELMTRWGKPNPPAPIVIAHLYPPGPSNPNYLKAIEKQGIEVTDEMRKLAEAAKTEEDIPVVDRNGRVVNQNAQGELSGMLMNSLNQLEEESEAPTLKLGDASCAAPFTSKLANVSAVTKIIRQGRCALVSTIQMYKILALNCLISAYSLSVIYLAGVKFGDGQATVSGLLISVCFLSISKGQPVEKLSKERPQPGIFNIYIMGSILGQFAVHIATLIYVTTEIYKLEPREPQLDLEKEFSPSLLNTGIFLIQLAQQVSTFAVNYQGRPFKESITENKGMYYGLLAVSGLAFAGSTEFIPELNEAMKFVPMTPEFKFKLTTTLVLDLGLSWAIELVLKYFFMDYKPADIAVRDNDVESKKEK
ncbi:Manganese-transporting ATPase 1 [Cyberlindnera fabianii]|uniref:Manganese-transporting ATPase 1 n=1 Tax=Cyberlindnera fabianii TaxID=36022 RepID=A0A1V2L4U3_CYBFA|nr:Manganese-transporting ATPase 1 [Cyberlindnera fabianii]